jgi:NADH dehydrogenase [ubiquinone] 1 alpha subcomplex assembly factor 5
MSDIAPPEIFDRKRRRALRERAGSRDGISFMWPLIAEELAERLLDVKRHFGRVLIIGPMAGYAQQILRDRKAEVTFAPLAGSECATPYVDVMTEDRMPFAPASFDLVIAAGTLDSVNDLPGALVQIRRCLRPDGLFLGHMFGAGTLAQLKNMMIAAQDSASSAHIHPQIDLKNAADLLSRAGFALPVVDRDAMQVRYSSWRRLVDDLRDMGVGNALSGKRRYLGRDFTHRLQTLWYQYAAADGKVEEQFVHLHLSGWAPSDDQPRPAKRGSGQISLTAAFNKA